MSSLLSSFPTLQFCFYLSSESQPNVQIPLYQRLHSSLDKKDTDSFVRNQSAYLRKSTLVSLGWFFIPHIPFSCSVILSFKNNSWALILGLRMNVMHLPRVLSPFCIVKKPGFPFCLSGVHYSSFWLILAMLRIMLYSHWTSFEKCL